MSTERRIQVVLEVNAEKFIAMFERINQVMAKHGPAIEAWSRHHPLPLPIDGRAYHQRRRNRRRSR